MLRKISTLILDVDATQQLDSVLDKYRGKRDWHIDCEQGHQTRTKRKKAPDSTNCMKKPPLTILAVLLFTVQLSIGLGVVQGSYQESGELSETQTESSWRFTKYGWQDSSNWYVDTFAPSQYVEAVHPLTFAIFILMTVAMTVIWASSEWEFDQLFADPQLINEDDVQETPTRPSDS